MLGDEADRLVREERARRQAMGRANEEKGEREALSHFQGVADETEALVPIILELLKQKGYPKRREILLPGPNSGFFNRRPTSIVKAGWYIGSYNYTHYGNEQGVEIYLLSDGRIAFRRGGFPGANAHTLHELRSRSDGRLVTCRDGLNSLRKELENMR